MYLGHSNGSKPLSPAVSLRLLAPGEVMNVLADFDGGPVGLVSDAQLHDGCREQGIVRLVTRKVRESKTVVSSLITMPILSNTRVPDSNSPGHG